MARNIRGKGEGSITRRSNGTWLAQVSLQGRRLSKTFKTQREAQRWIRETKNQIDDGLTYDSTNKTLIQFLESWIVSSKPSYSRTTWR
jgi:hypothetical protein